MMMFKQVFTHTGVSGFAVVSSRISHTGGFPSYGKVLMVQLYYGVVDIE
jgi:hypothetical protein